MEGEWLETQDVLQREYVERILEWSMESFVETIFNMNKVKTTRLCVNNFKYHNVA